VNRTGSRVEQAEKALAEPFKHADALKAAQKDSARIDQLMADAAKPDEPAQQEPPTEVDPRMEDRRSRVVRHRCPRFGRRPALPGVPAVPGGRRWGPGP
jgi:hypothetical protein